MPAAADVRRKIPRPHQPGVVSQCRGHDPASAEAGLDHRCGHPFELTEDIRLPHDAAAQHHQSRVKSVDQGYDTTGDLANPCIYFLFFIVGSFKCAKISRPVVSAG